MDDSIELCLHGKLSTDEIREAIEPLGFGYECHTQNGEISWLWFDTSNELASLRGCSLTTSNYEKDEERDERLDELKGPAEWVAFAVITTTEAGRSIEDARMQQEALLSLQHHHGGRIYDHRTDEWAIDGEWVFPLPEPFSIWERRADSLLRITHHTLDQLDKLLTNHKEEDNHLPNPPEMLRRLTSTGPFLANSVLPLLVSAFENFCEAFLALTVEGVAPLRTQLLSQDSSLKYRDLGPLLAGELTPSELYFREKKNFQRFNEVLETYRKFAHIDLSTIWSEDEQSQLRELLKSRHKIVHELGLDHSLEPMAVRRTLQTVRACLEALANAIEEKHNFRSDHEW